MKKLIQIAAKILREDEGASMVEYAVGVGFIAAAVITGATYIGTKLDLKLKDIGDEIASAVF